MILYTKYGVQYQVPTDVAPKVLETWLTRNGKFLAFNGLYVDVDAIFAIDAQLENYDNPLTP